MFFLHFIKEVESKEAREHFFSFSGNTGEEIQDRKERKIWSGQGKKLCVRMRRRQAGALTSLLYSRASSYWPE